VSEGNACATVENRVEIVVMRRVFRVKV